MATHLLEGFPNEYNRNILQTLRERLAMHNFGYGPGVLPHTLYFSMEPTRSYREQIDKISGPQIAQDWPDGESVPMDTLDQEWNAFTIKQAGYGLGIAASRHMLQYNDRGATFLSKYVPALVDAFIHLERTKHANVLNNAFTAASATYGDGKELCATDHVTSGGTRSNELATPAALSWASIENMRLLGANHVMYNGQSRPIFFNRLIVPTALRRTALQLTGGAFQHSSMDRNINPDQGAEMVIVESMLTSTTVCFLLSTTDNPLVSKIGRPREFRSYPHEPSESQVYYGATDFKETAKDFVGIVGNVGA